MANNPTREEVVKEISAELYDVKVALTAANEKLVAAFGEGYEILATDITCNDPNALGQAMEITLHLDNVKPMVQEVPEQTFNPVNKTDFGLTTETTTVMALQSSGCQTLPPTGAGDNPCCGRDMAWILINRRWYCVRANGCRI